MMAVIVAVLPVALRAFGSVAYQAASRLSSSRSSAASAWSQWTFVVTAPIVRMRVNCSIRPRSFISNAVSDCQAPQTQSMPSAFSASSPPSPKIMRQTVSSFSRPMWG